MDPIEAEGNTIDEAIGNALQQLGAPRERVDIEILSNAQRGLFGLGGRKARVRASLRAPLAMDGAPPRPPAERPPQPRPAAPSRGGETPDPESIGASAARFLENVITLIGVEASVHSENGDDHLRLELRGDSSGVLIGRRGQMLDALEYLVNRFVSRDDLRASRIVVDSEDYRDRRRQSLENLARRMSEQAKKKRKPVTLNPMSPRDRRIVHLALEGDPAVSTKSAGKGFFRKVIITPTGAGRAGRPPA